MVVGMLGHNNHLLYMSNVNIDFPSNLPYFTYDENMKEKRHYFVKKNNFAIY